MFSRRNQRFSEEGSEAVPCLPVLASIGRVEADHEEEREASARQEAEARVDDYLDHVTAQMLALPYARRAEIRRELAQHLWALAAAHEELGETPEEAIEAALRKFGDPARIGRAYRRVAATALLQDGTSGKIFPSAALRQGLIWFGLATTLFGATISLGLQPFHSLAAYRLWEGLVFAAFVGLPLAAGWKVGAATPARAGAGAFYALSILAPIALSVSHVALQDNLPWPPALVSAFWVPLGSVSAAVSSAVHRRRCRVAR